MINTLQFVVFFTEWQAQMPANAVIAIKTFRNIALGEFIPYEWLTEKIDKLFGDVSAGLGSRESESEGDVEADSSGHSNVLSNIGIMLVMLGLILIITLIVVLFMRLCKQCPRIIDLFTKLR